ncbi:MAG: hypothetical protein ACP5HS_12570 [Anaerolineae bacterium]
MTLSTEADVRSLKEAGFNYVRVPFNYRLFAGSDASEILSGPGYALLDALVDWYREVGL